MHETKSLLRKERLKEKLGKQDLQYDMEEVFEPVTARQAEATENQKQLSEKQIQAIGQQTQGFVQALRDSSQTTTQAIQLQTKAIQQNSDILNKNIEKSIKEYDAITNCNNHFVTDLVNSNQVDSSFVKIVSNLLNFRLQPVEGNSNLFTINHTNPQPEPIKGSTMTFQNGNTYNLIDPDLSYFITDTQIDKEMQNEKLIYNFLGDMKYDLNHEDSKSRR